MSQWQTIKTAFRQPWVQSVSSCIFFVLAYDGGRPVLSLTVSPSHQQYMASLIIAAELARGVCRAVNSKTISALVGIWITTFCLTALAVLATNLPHYNTISWYGGSYFKRHSMEFLEYLLHVPPQIPHKRSPRRSNGNPGFLEPPNFQQYFYQHWWEGR